MQKKRVAVLDIGSSKMTAFIGERGVNKTFIIKGFKEIEYSGYVGGEFLNLAETTDVIKQLAVSLKTSSPDTEKIFVGVPAGFTRNIVRDAQISFNKKRKITEKEVYALYERGYKDEIIGCSVINRSPILFELDDFRKTPDAMGEFSSTLKGRISYILCIDYFTKTIRSALAEIGFDDVEFVSVALAEAMYLIAPEQRDRLALLVDVGYIASTFMLVQGDGILYQRSFDYGGGFITAGLTERFDADFDVAEKLKRKVTLSIDASSDDVYEVINGDECVYFNKNKVKTTILSSLDKLAEEIDTCFKNTRINIPEYLPLLITGGGVCFLRGAKEHLSNRLNVIVDTVSPNIPLYDTPINSSYLSVLNLALEQQ